MEFLSGHHRYVTGYSCKGDKNPEQWRHTRNALTDAYCSDPKNADKSLMSLVGSHMADICSATNVSKDHALYCLAGGLLKRVSVPNILKCAV